MRRRSHQRHPVFQDARHRRARVLKILASLSAFTLLTWMTAFATGVYYIDILPENAKLERIRQGMATVEAPAAAGPAPVCVGEPLAADDLLAAGAGAPVSAYLRVAAPGALTAISRHCRDVDGVLAEWLRIDAATQATEWLGETEPAAALAESPTPLTKTQPGRSGEGMVSRAWPWASSLTATVSGLHSPGTETLTSTVAPTAG